MNKIRLILPLFGEAPHRYFSLFLNSIFQNKNIVDMLIVTDDINIKHLSFVHKCSNISTLVISHEELGQKVKDAVKKIFNFTLDTPFAATVNNRSGFYKLCDYKFFLGEMFKEELASYEYWGFLDWDTIFGDIRAIIPDFEKHSVLGTRGHFCCVKNTSQVYEILQDENNWYWLNVDIQKNKHLVKQRICDPLKNILVDEHFIQPTLLKYAKENPDKLNVLDTLVDDIICDISFHNMQGDKPGEGFNMWRMHNYKNQYFLYDKGKLFRVSEEDNIKTEHAYMHLIGRTKLMNNMVKEEDINDELQFIIRPNFFEPYVSKNV